MAVKDTNERIIITFTKKQATWLRETANKMHWTTSRLVRQLLNTNTTKLANFLTEEEFKKLREIAKVPWVFDEEIDEVLIR